MGPLDIALGVVFPIFLGTGIGVAMAAGSSAEFWVARIAFIAAALDLGGLVIWGLYNSDRSLWRYAFGIAIFALLVVGLPVVLQWIDAREEIATKKVPRNVGVLEPKTELLFSPTGNGSIPTIQIGQSGVLLVGAESPIGSQLFPALRQSQFKVESIAGKMKVSTQITDRDGKLIAEIIRNEWKTSPEAWDRNYSDDALEVKDAEGNIVLQVRVLSDRIQIQGAWWIDMGPPNGIRWMFIWKDPTKEGAQIAIFPKDTVNPPSIPPMFEYPSDHHLGELRRQ